MKPYNNKKYWIDSGIVRPVTIEADSINDALQEYKNICNEKSGIYISNNAINNKEPMFIDDETGNARQAGYVITGKTEINDDYKFTTQYIDLWVSIDILQNAF
jgi:ribulose bisphosphate carboxylase small subunit